MGVVKYSNGMKFSSVGYGDNRSSDVNDFTCVNSEDYDHCIDSVYQFNKGKQAVGFHQKGSSHII